LSIGGILTGVATNSSRDAWAVGITPLGPPDRPILAHWDGRTWKKFSTAALPSFGGLAAVTPVKGGDWVVGHAGYVPEGTIGHVRPLILRLSGKTWKRMPLPDTGKGELNAVTATSASNAWAVGYINDGPPLILHWNGRAWKRVPFPKIGTGNFLRGVAATSATDAWAVGNHRGKALIVHWGGKRWRPGRHAASGGSLRNAVRRDRHLGQERLGGGLGRQQHLFDPALEWQVMAAGAGQQPG
jgi:hypothetical protein